MSGNLDIRRFLVPALAIIATLVALFGPWFTRTTQVTQRTLDATLLEIIQGNAFVEYTSMRWLWISGVGVLLVIASAVVGDSARKRLAEGGSWLMIILPGWSLFHVFAGDEDIDAGWGLWVTAVLVVAAIVLARQIPEAEQSEPILTQPGE